MLIANSSIRGYYSLIFGYSVTLQGNLKYLQKLVSLQNLSYILKTPNPSVSYLSIVCRIYGLTLVTNRIPILISIICFRKRGNIFPLVLFDVYLWNVFAIP